MNTASLSQIKEAITFGDITEVNIATIIEGLTQADDLYYNDDESLIDDNQYDAIRKYAQRIDPSNVYFTGVGSAVRGGKVKLPHTMGSLNQVYQGEYTQWVTKHALGNDDVVVSDKLDGNSGMVVYGKDGTLQIAYSRGDGTNGADITRHISKIHNVPKRIKVSETTTIRGEVIITPGRFELIKTLVKSQSGRMYKNPRNFVSGRMNASEGQDLVYNNIEFVAYEIVGSTDGKSVQLDTLNGLGFDVVKHTVHKASSLNDEVLTKLLVERRAVSGYEIDGVVIDVDLSSTRKRINPTTDSLNPEYAIKFKVSDASNYAEPTVTGVSWAISKDGYLKPTIQFTPVNIVGVTIQNCTGFNAAFIRDNKIGKGAKIAIVRSGDVIPFITKVITPAGTPDMPEMEDDAHWTVNSKGEQVDLVLDNARDNATVKFEQLVDFFASIDVPGLGEGNLRPMFEAGFETPESIIELTVEDIGSLIGSLVVGKKIFTGIRDKLTNIPLYVLMGSHAAFGRGVGKRKMKKLWESFAGDMTKCTDVNNIVSTEGFDVKTATKIANGYVEFAHFFETISKYVTIAEYVAPSQGGMSGQVVVFTGIRSKELETVIEAAGGKIGSGVSSKTTYLVSADPKSTSGKTQKALELGVKVVGIEEMWKIVK